MKTLTITTLAVALVALSGVGPAVRGQQPNVERRVLLQQDVTIAGYQNVLIAVTIPPGGREGRHTHPGTLLVHVLEGVMTLEHEGRPTTTYKAGDSVHIEPGRVHEGMNKGTAPVRAIASLVAEKGKPLAAQVP